MNPEPSEKLGRGFSALMVSQSVGAFNDNLFKTYLSLAITATVVSSDAPLLLSLATALFILPNFFFSTYAGWCADRFSKRTVLLVLRFAELIIVAAGTAALLSGSITGMLLVLLLLGLQSTFFAPSKYGILPEILPLRSLSRGNGYLEMWTFFSILVGTAVAGQIRGLFPSPEVVVSLVLLASTIVGCVAAFRITPTVARNPSLEFDRNVYRSLRNSFSEMRQVPYLMLTNLAIAWFWCAGAFGQIGIILLARDTLGLGDLGTGILVTVLALGIGVGSVAAGKLSHHRIELGLVPLGALGIAASLLALGFFGDITVIAWLGTLILGFSGGMYIVPLYAFFQSASHEDSRGRMMAASNVVSYGGMLLAAAFVPLCTTVLGLSIQETFLALGIIAVGLAWWVVATLPDALVRAVNFLLTNLVYRVEVRGADKLPLKGGALLCCNHVSYVDASLILSITKRPVRFLMYRKIYEIPVIHQVARAAGAIPVMAGESKDKIADSLSAATDAIRSGELVCLFPEGGITRDGELKPFRKGLERIMAPVDAPIYPVALLRLWGSIFSYSRRPFLRLPERFPYPVEIVIGDPLPHTATAEEVRLAVARLIDPTVVYETVDP